MGGTGGQSLEIHNSVTGSVMFFSRFPAFYHLFTPPKTPSVILKIDDAADLEYLEAFNGQKL